MRFSFMELKLMVSKRIKIAIIVVVVLIIGLFGTGATLSVIAQMEHVSDVQVRNPEGTAGVAICVYQPGISNFQEQVTNAIVDGLISNDFRVDITTASSQTPTDISNYDLLVLGSPTYGETPAQPVMNYLNRVGDLGGMATVIIITAGGSGTQSADTMENSAQDANGVIVKTLIIYNLAPNEELYGTSDPLEIATNAGQEILLP